MRWVAAPLHAAIFRGIEWEGTLHAANALNLQVVSVGDWADVDEASDLARLMSARQISALRALARGSGNIRFESGNSWQFWHFAILALWYFFDSWHSWQSWHFWQLI
ncbi:hypothetical protein BH24ACI4_BH24ACI4_17470 [soil metagenome]